MGELETLSPSWVSEGSEKLEVLARSFPEGASEFQLRNFNIFSEPTLWGRARQSLNEGRMRVLSLEKLYIDRELLQIKLEKINLSPSDEQDPNCLEARSQRLEVMKLKIDLRELQRQIDTLERELNIILTILKEIPEDLNGETEQDYWERRITRMIKTNLVFHQPISINIVESAINMPEGSPIREWMETVLTKGDEPEGEVAEERGQVRNG